MRRSVIGTILLLNGIILTAEVSRPPDETALVFEVATVKPILPGDQRQRAFNPFNPAGYFGRSA